MNLPFGCRLVCLVAASGISCHVQAESFTSSASSAGSASSGSVSDSLSSSSDSSSDTEKTAGGNYRIIDVAQAPDRNDFRRVTMQSDESQRHIVLDLPLDVIDKQRLRRGDLVSAQRRVYGLEFARGDTQEAFYLVLADDWHDELAVRPVASL